MNAMPTLAIATSGPHGEIALAREGRAAHRVRLAAGHGRGRDALPALRKLLADADAHVRDVDRIVVDVGPGSFTGVRVGVTLAKTLAWALGIRTWSVDSLTLLASTADADGAPVLAVRDAGRGTVYHRLGQAEDDPPLGRSPGAALATAATGTIVVGEEARALAARFGWRCEPRDVCPGAEALLELLERGRGIEVAAHDLAPTYLQASAPERKAAGEVP